MMDVTKAKRLESIAISSVPALPCLQNYFIALENRLDDEQVVAFLNSSESLFVYGSLQIPKITVPIISEIKTAPRVDEAQLAKNMTPAKLASHQIFARKDSIYPAIVDVKDPDETATGMVIFGLLKKELRCLDRYERGQYSRETCEVKIQLNTGEMKMIQVYTYMYAGKSRDRIDPQQRPWTLKGFLSDHADLGIGEFCLGQIDKQSKS